MHVCIPVNVSAFYSLPQKLRGAEEAEGRAKKQQAQRLIKEEMAIKGSYHKENIFFSSALLPVNLLTQDLGGL